MRRHRALKMFGGVMIAITAAAAVAYLIILPRIVRQQVDVLLERAGIEHASFDVLRATLSRTLIGDVALGPDQQLTANRIGVTYSLLGVRRGDLKQVNISGLRFIIESKGGRIDLGPLARLDLGGNGANTRGATGGGAEPPVRGVHLRESLLVLRTSERSIEIPVQGDVVAQGDLYFVTLTFDVGTACVLTGKVAAATGNASATLRCESADADRVLAIVHALFPAADVELEGSVSATASARWQQGKGTLEATIRATGDAAEPGAAGNDPELGDTNLIVRRGVLKIDATFGPQAEESLRLTVSDAALASSDVELEGVSGSVAFTGFAPLTSPPGQTLHARKLEVGGLEMNDGTVQFQVQAPTAVAIERTEWNWLGGKVSAADVAVAAGKPIDFVLHADNVELRQLLDLLAEEHAQGRGRISGDLPIRVEEGNLKFGEGQFSAVPGGEIEIKNVEAIAGGAAEASKGRAETPSQQEQVRRNIIEALKDFEYDVLKAELTTEPDGSLGADVRIAGRGRTGARQAIDYKLRVRGLDVLLETLLEERRAIAAGSADEPAAAATTGKVEP